MSAPEGTRGGWLDDYEPVDERIRRFYADHPEGLLRSEIVTELTTETRICIRALAYRAPGETPAVGHSWLNIPGGTAFTRGSEIENAETSAWGRALAALGYGGKRIATAEELASKQPAPGERTVPPRRPTAPAVRGPGRVRPASSPSEPPAPRTEAEEALLSELIALPGMTKARLSLIADQAGIPKGAHATEAQLRAMLTIAGWKLPETHDGAGVESPPVPAPSPEEAPA